VFWEGPHVRRMRSWVEAWLAHPDVARTPKKSVIQETTADD
jgi:hypothetical protein